MAQDNALAPLANDSDPEDDARTLKKHAQITSDPKRHAAAHQVLQQQQADTKTAVKNSQKSMHAKVKKGLAKAFPKDDGNTPFNKAGKSGGTPFDDAAE
jgi:hypothetical protein